MTRLEKFKLKRNTTILQSRIREAKAEIQRIRSDHDYLDAEVLDVLCHPLTTQLELLREELISNLIQRFLLLPLDEQAKILEAELSHVEDDDKRGECH